LKILPVEPRENDVCGFSFSVCGGAVNFHLLLTNDDQCVLDCQELFLTYFVLVLDKGNMKREHGVPAKRWSLIDMLILSRLTAPCRLLATRTRARTHSPAGWRIDDLCGENRKNSYAFLTFSRCRWPQ
jgi:hypothetical protein